MIVKEFDDINIKYAFGELEENKLFNGVAMSRVLFSAVAGVGSSNIILANIETEKIYLTTPDVFNRCASVDTQGIMIMPESCFVIFDFEDFDIDLATMT